MLHADAIAPLARSLDHELGRLAWDKRIPALTARHPDLSFAFSTSFSLEDQALTDVLARCAAGSPAHVRVFTLDTGRLFEEVHALHQRTREHYGLVIETWSPDAAELTELVGENGINGFYGSVDARLACCHVRKVRPLERALAGVDVWISGLRREQSEHRSTLPVAEPDPARRLVKVYPLADVSTDALWDYIRSAKVPFNEMHERGYPSIGCAPCTRAIGPEEHPRAGRWWWEQESARECGLHLQGGKLGRRRRGDIPPAPSEEAPPDA